MTNLKKIFFISVLSFLTINLPLNLFSGINAVIFCNGELSVSNDYVYSVVSKNSLIIAADGGANHLEKLNIKPDLIIGDMDSITAQSFLDDETIEKIVYDSDKDQTDTELAVIEAFARGSENITLLGATGRRFDHTIANIELIKKYPGKITLIDNNTKVMVINNQQKLVIKGQKESVLSIFSVDTSSSNITLSGLQYNLNNQKLLFPTQGTSNTVQQNPAFISIDSGLLLVCVEIYTELTVTI